MTRIGSLFSGAGGLDMAVESVFGGRVIWHSEVDKAASKVLAYRYPGVPNLGDITTIDWSRVEPVDILCGGFPCTDVSAAGKRAGLHGTRSGLWSYYAQAIDELRPRMVVIENVRGLLSAHAARPMESDDVSVGDGGTVPVLRAAGAVLGDLADLFYDAWGTTVSASSVGAPHRRERVFIIARAADAQCIGQQRQADHPCGGKPNVAGCGGRCESEGSGTASCCGSKQVGTHAYPQGDGWNEGRPESAVGGFDAAVSGDEPGVHQTTLPGEARLLCTPSASDGAGGKTSRSGGRIDEPLLGGQAREMESAWGKYEPAIRRWERIVGPAPAPTAPNKNGNPRLSAAFSEWLMGWPAGWVTDPAIGISRNDQLRIVGNGVVPAQAVAALTYLLTVAKGEDMNRDRYNKPYAANPLLPTPVVNDMGDSKTVDWWDTWCAEKKAQTGNGNGHGNSLAIEVQRISPYCTYCGGEGYESNGGTAYMHRIDCPAPPTHIVVTDV